MSKDSYELRVKKGIETNSYYQSGRWGINAKKTKALPATNKEIKNKLNNYYSMLLKQGVITNKEYKEKKASNNGLTYEEFLVECGQMNKLYIKRQRLKNVYKLFKGRNNLITCSVVFVVVIGLISYFIFK